MLRPDKNILFMRQARAFADMFSKDASTKVGALLVDPKTFSVLSRGYNGIPRQVDETQACRHQRPTKYAFYEHAERNAIFNRVRPALKGAIAVSTRFPSTSCARALASVGIAELHAPQCSAVDSEEGKIVRELLEESGASLHFTNTLAVKNRHEQKIARYAEYASHIAPLMSKDLFSEATLILSPGDYTILCDGYSGMPRGAQDYRAERWAGDLRKMWVEGSARNAIYNFARPIFEGSVGFVTATTCVECARAFVACGVSEIIYVEPDADIQARWGDSFKTALDMLRELNVPASSMRLG